jgi:NAD(P)-dependent dehydrogenase (short-subunit alcohol dehydrogenase family)
MSEGWYQQLQPRGIGVSVLCPGFVRTRINESARTRQQRYGKPASRSSEIQAAADQMVQSGIPADPVGARVVEAIKAGELYIFTHAEMRALTEMRFEAIRAAWDMCEKSPALKGLAPRELGSLHVLPPKGAAKRAR